MENFSLKEIPKFKNPEEELAFLREHIAQREEELRAGNREIPREEIAHQTIEAYKQIDAHDVLKPSEHLKLEEVEGFVLRLRPEPHDHTMEELLGILLHKGVKNALEVVEKLNDPHIDDDFHRFLIQYLSSNGDMPGLKSNTPLWKALHMKLFEITLPPLERTEKNFKEFISAMEQFYAGMHSIASSRENYSKDYFTIEIALSNESDEVVIYAAVPHLKQSLFEKQVLAFYEQAKIREVSDDYNIFTEKGVSVGACATLSGHEIFPIKTYDKFEHDPISSILGVFSKLKKQGEGAAIQFVICPLGEDKIKKFSTILDQVKNGMEVKKADKLFSEFDRKFFKATKELIFGIEKKSEQEKEEEKKVDENAVSNITEKLKSTIVHSNIRVIASAATKLRAEEILSDIESAFNQFTEPQSNSLIFERTLDKNIGHLLHDFSYRMYNEEKALPFNLKELSTLFHFPVGVSSSPQLKEAKSGIAPAPLSVSHSGILLGVNDYRGSETEIRMEREDRLRHFYVIGQTGTGKTTILKNMIAQDIRNGDGCCFIDPHGTDIQDILSYIPKERLGDVIYFDPSYTARPMGLNMLEYDPRYPEQKSFVVDEMLSIFNKLFDMKTAGGPMFEQYFRNAVLLVIDNPESGSTLLDVSRVLSDEKYRNFKLSKCTNPIVTQFWNNIASRAGGEASLANIVPYITSKFDVFLSNDIMRPIVGQEKSVFNFRKIMDEKKILLVNLSKGKLGDLNANLLGLILVGKIQMAALSRVDMYGQDMNDFYLYMDEFQNITTDSIASILSEARKYHLSLNIAHQYISQLQDTIKNAVFGNVGSMAVFRVSSDDAKYLESRFLPTFTASDISKLENRNAYVNMLINGNPAKPFNIRTLPPQQGNALDIEKLKQISYLSYGRERSEIEAEIAEKYMN